MTPRAAPATLALDRLRTRLDGLEGRNPGAVLLVVALAAGAAFLVFERLFHACAALDPLRYTAPVIVVSALRDPVPLLAAGVVALHALALRRLRWRDYEQGQQLRLLAGSAACILAFAFATYDFNYVYGRWHAADRVLLVALALGVFRHPVFLGPFLLEVFLVAGQFHFPLLYSWTDKRVVFDVLVLLWGGLGVAALPRRRSGLPVLAAILCLVGMHYLKPGIGKLGLEWLSRDELTYIFSGAAHQNGWLEAIGGEGRARVASWIGPLGGPAKIVTLLVEVGIAALFFSRPLAVALCVGAAGMHLGIFAASGIFFWKWIALDAVLAGLLLALPRDVARRLFGWRAGALGAAAMGLGLLVYRGPVLLAWYDAPLSYRFQIEAVGASGAVYQVPPYAFAPYDLPFSQARFYFLTETPRLVDALGTTGDLAVLDALEAARSPADLGDVRTRFGSVRRDPVRAGRFEALLRRYFAHRSAHPGRGLPLRAPLHIWSEAQRDIGLAAYAGQEPVVAARVRLLEVLHPSREERGGQEQRVADEIVLHMDLGPAPRSSANSASNAAEKPAGESAAIASASP